MVTKKLYYRQSKYVHLQKQFYLRKKHLLYLSPWMYAESRFFYFQEKVFFYRLLFEEIISEQAGRSQQWKYLNWLQKIEPNKTTWLYPMVDKKKIFQLLYQECEEIFLMSNRNKL